jgi:4-amino-4-deoxy-L-arabinose transferase-like glycosyltransferase
MRLPISAVKAGAVFFWALVLFVYFWNLGGGSLEFWDESLSAERAREFLLTGDWLTPHSSLEPVFNKPPVYYWLTALNFAVLGESEFTVRLASVLFGIGCLMFVCLLGRKVVGSEWGGLLAAFLLATNPHWINYTRNGMLDSGLMFGTLAGIYFLMYGRPAGGVVFSGVALALGCLIKNPIALAGLAVPIAQNLFVEKTLRWGRRVFFAALIACLLSLIWYGLEYLKWGNAYLNQFVGYNMLQRFSRPIEGHDSSPLFYLKVWSGGSIVSFALFVLPLAYLLARRRAVLRPLVPYLIVLFALLAILELSASKRGFYLLLIYPFVAIASAGMWASILGSIKAPSVRAGVIALLVVASGIYLGARYKPCIRGAESLKEMAVRLKADADASSVIYTLGIPSEPVMFYSHMLSRSVWDEVSPASLDAMLKRAGGDVYLLARKNGKGRALQAIAEASIPANLAYENADYSAILLPHR